MSFKVQMTTNQLKSLIEGVRITTTVAFSLPDQTSTITVKPVRPRTFADCKFRFSGERDFGAVITFLTSEIPFKEAEGICDEDALRGLPLLLDGLAATWWKGVRKDAKSWNEAVDLMQNYFAPTKPPYQLYMEIFQQKQTPYMSIESFVYTQKALFAQLPEGRHDEESELDMIYGLLHPDYRKYIPRDKVKTYKDLLEKGYRAERVHDAGRGIVTLAR